MRLIAVLDGLADHRDTRGTQQLAQFAEVVAVAQRTDAEGPLLGAALGLDIGIARRRTTAVPAALHHHPV